VTSLLQEDVEWTGAAREEFLRTINEETDRLNALVGNLLDMSRLQAGALTVSAGPIGLVGSRSGSPPLARRTREPRPNRGSRDPAARVGRSGLLERALANLLDNALRHCPEDTEVRVVADPTGDEYVDLRIVDHGPGVPSRRGSESSSPSSSSATCPARNGVGLGLAVARGFIEAMEGSIEGKETPGGGLTMIVRLRAER